MSTNVVKVEDSQDALSIQELLDDERDNDHASVMEKKLQHYRHLKYIRIVILWFLWLAFIVMLFITHEDKGEYLRTVVPVDGKKLRLQEQPDADKLTLKVKAPFKEQLHDIVDGRYRGKALEQLSNEETKHKLYIHVQRSFISDTGQSTIENVSELLEYSLVQPAGFDDLKIPRLDREHIFTLKPSSADGVYTLTFLLDNVDKPLPLELKTYPSAIKTPVSIALSALLMAGMFVLFFWDVVSRGIVAILFSNLTIGLLGIYNLRQPLRDILNHVDLDTILLIFGLTLIIVVFAETGGDLYLAVQFYRLSNGHIWPMLTVMCLIIAFGAAFLDSTTILILITSLAIRLCEIMKLNPTSVLTCLILFSNTGYMLTRSGLAEDSILSQRGVIDNSLIFKSYGSFLLQMLLPVCFAMCLTYAYLRLYYGNSQKMRIVEPTIVSRLRNAIRFWSRTAQAMPGYTKEETALRQDMLSKVYRLRQRLRRLGKMPAPAENFQQRLEQLQAQHTIRDPVLLVMCCVVLVAVIAMQIAYIMHAHELSPGWTCILFALVLLALANWKEFESLMSKIDWSTLVTIACLYIVSRALKPLGLMEAIGDNTLNMINNISRRYRLNTASIMLLIVTTFCSAFMDSEHVSYVMSKKALDMAFDPENDMLWIDPLLLSIILGTGFGTNATLVSAISNIVCAGLAEKHGFKFYFWDFFKVGFVVTVFNMIMGIIYLLIFNAVLGFN